MRTLDCDALLEHCQNTIDRPVVDMLSSSGEEDIRRGARQAFAVLQACIEDGHFDEHLQEGIHITLVKDGIAASIVLDLSYETSDDIYLATMRQLEAVRQKV